MNADCINTVGSRNCRCRTGFAGDGITCTPAIPPFTCPGRTSPYHAPNYVAANDRISVPSGKSVMNKNDKIVSNKGRFTVIMQTDCNLVLYDARQGKGGYDPSAAKWASNTWLSNAYTSCYAEVTKNGVLTVIGGSRPFTSTAARFSTDVAPLIFVIQDDGNFVSYQCDEPYWASNTWTQGAYFKQILPSLNPDFIPSTDLVEGLKRGCFKDDAALCESGKDIEIGHMEEKDLAF